MTLGRDVLDRLLVAKGLLGPIRFAQADRPDRISLARQILAAHDAAELVLAAVTHHLGKHPKSLPAYLMDYFPLLKEEHPAEEVPGRGYFAQLNRVRSGIKHHGDFPDAQQWHRAGERVWIYLSAWCHRYLGLSLDDVDESALIRDADVKRCYDDAVQAFQDAQYQTALEHLAFATAALHDSNQALRNLSVGIPRAEDAIKLAAFGVHANDYLALQEFLPRLEGLSQRVVKWEQATFGHPANWTEDAVAFCLKTFVEMALRIQDAEWIPGAIDFHLLYEHEIIALVDGVEIVRTFTHAPPEVIRTLRKGESVRGSVRRKHDYASGLLAILLKPQPPTLIIVSEDENLSGEIEADKVTVKCVPRNNPSVRQYFPDLPVIDYDPNDP